VNVEAAYPVTTPNGQILIAFAVDDLGRARKAIG
jgi:hypothetical protein